MKNKREIELSFYDMVRGIGDRYVPRGRRVWDEAFSRKMYQSLQGVGETLGYTKERVRQIRKEIATENAEEILQWARKVLLNDETPHFADSSVMRLYFESNVWPRQLCDLIRVIGAEKEFGHVFGFPLSKVGASHYQNDFWKSVSGHIRACGVANAASLEPIFGWELNEPQMIQVANKLDDVSYFKGVLEARGNQSMGVLAGVVKALRLYGDKASSEEIYFVYSKQMRDRSRAASKDSVLESMAKLGLISPSEERTMWDLAFVDYPTNNHFLDDLIDYFSRHDELSIQSLIKRTKGKANSVLQGVYSTGFLVISDTGMIRRRPAGVFDGRGKSKKQSRLIVEECGDGRFSLRRDISLLTMIGALPLNFPVRSMEKIGLPSGASFVLSAKGQEVQAQIGKTGSLNRAGMEHLVKSGVMRKGELNLIFDATSFTLTAV